MNVELVAPCATMCSTMHVQHYVVPCGVVPCDTMWHHVATYPPASLAQRKTSNQITKRSMPRDGRIPANGVQQFQKNTVFTLLKALDCCSRARSRVIESRRNSNAMLMADAK